MDMDDPTSAKMHNLSAVDDIEEALGTLKPYMYIQLMKDFANFWNSNAKEKNVTVK